MKLLLWMFVVFCIVFDGCEYSQFHSRDHSKLTNGNITRKMFRKEYTVETKTGFMAGATSDLSKFGKLAKEHRHRRDREHKDKKRHGHSLHYAKVTMPTGMTVSITTPYKDPHFKCGDHAKLMEVKFSSHMFRKEYIAIKWDFLAGTTTDLHVKVVKIEKVLNPCLWSKYVWRKQQIIAEAKEANEMMLFHSSSYNRRNMDKGFDERYAKIGSYGAGLHFYPESSKVHENSKLQSDGTRTVLLCRVALGKSSEIGPTKLAHAPVGYQSVRDDTDDYVIYRGEQAYPEYLITYKT